MTTHSRRASGLKPNAFLHPFQIAGVRFLAERRFAILADDRGLGKTRQALVALSEIETPAALVLVPSIPGRNLWEAEIAATPGVRLDRSKTGVLPSRGTVRVTTTTELLRRRLSPRATPHPSSVLVIDDPGFLALAPGTRLRTKFSRLADLFVRADGAIWILGAPDVVPYERFCALLETVGFMLRRRQVSAKDSSRRKR
jgi:hypothetical protein